MTYEYRLQYHTNITLEVVGRHDVILGLLDAKPITYSPSLTPMLPVFLIHKLFGT